MLLVETSRESKVGELDVTLLVDQDVVRFNISVDEAEVVDGLDGKDAFRHVELGHVLGECVVLDQPGASEQREDEGGQ